MIKQKIEMCLQVQNDIIAYYEDEIKKLKNEISYLEGITRNNLIIDKNSIEQIIRDYATYSFNEGTIDKDVKYHLIEDAQNFVNGFNNDKKEIKIEQQKEEVKQRKKVRQPYDCWLDSVLSGFKFYRRLRGGTWYQRRCKEPWLSCRIYGHKEIWWDISWVESRDVEVVKKEEW